MATVKRLKEPSANDMFVASAFLQGNSTLACERVAEWLREKAESKRTKKVRPQEAAR